jgi:hypothetical protein
MSGRKHARSSSAARADSDPDSLSSPVPVRSVKPQTQSRPSASRGTFRRPDFEANELTNKQGGADPTESGSEQARIGLDVLGDAVLHRYAQHYRLAAPPGRPDSVAAAVNAYATHISTTSNDIGDSHSRRHFQHAAVSEDLSDCETDILEAFFRAVCRDQRRRGPAGAAFAQTPFFRRRSPLLRSASQSVSDSASWASLDAVSEPRVKRHQPDESPRATAAVCSSVRRRREVFFV